MPSLVDEISKFFAESANPVLFAGAGVSARAGLPTWGSYVNTLAEGVRAEDPLTATLMLECARDEDYLKAASYFYLTSKVRQVDKFRLLTQPLGNFEIAPIACLAGLPFGAYVTTNFDRVLPDLYAYANRKSASTLDLGDPAMASASFRDEFFISRIHGKTDDPNTMVLSEEHYRDIGGRPGYVQLLRNIFTFRQVLFIGFSFYDPAIRKVLDLANAELGPLHEGRHLALIPEGVSDEFVRRLDRLNIRRVVYQPENHHEQLWTGICDAAKVLAAKQVVATDGGLARGPLTLARKYLASCYARTQLAGGLVPLREVVAEGFLIHLISAAGESGLSREDLKGAMRRDLQLSDGDADEIIEASMLRLRKDRLCRTQKGADGIPRTVWIPDGKTSTYENAVATLTKGILDRYVVREQGHVSQDIRNAVSAFFESLILRRGWDLGAAFAARKVPDPVDVEEIMWSVGNLLPPAVVEGLSRAAADMLSSPNQEEARTLVDLGRASFGIELAIQSPRDIFLHQVTLPQRIYLDASVLLPAIVAGHPLYAVYNDSIGRLVAAAERASMTVQVIALQGFLNEVINHRRLARETIAELGEGAFTHLEVQARAFGSMNMNVFLAGYVNTAKGDSKLSFEAYLAEHAPFESESHLAEWLLGRGMRVLSDPGLIGADTIYGAVYHFLEIAFADELARGIRRPVLLRHDAIQLSALHRDQSNKIASIFVSADRALRDRVGEGRFAELGHSMVSHVGLAQLIDLLVGTEQSGAAKGMSRLLWSGRVSTGLEIARNYLIDLALSKYDDAMAMSMGSVVDRIASKIEDTAAARGIDLTRAQERQRIEGARLLEEFEDEFFAGMREAIEKRARQGDGA